MDSFIDGEQKSITIELTPEDVAYLCDRMIANCDEYPVVGSHIVEMHDYFVELKAEAEKLEKLRESGKDGQEEKEEDR